MTQKGAKDPLSIMRHGARGYLNSIKLCVSALELPCTFDEQIEFIDDVIASSDKLVDLMSQFEQIPDSAFPALK